MDKLFTIYNDTLLSKVKDFIYIYNNISKHPPLSHILTVPKQQKEFLWHIIQNHVEIDKLRGVSKKTKVGDQSTVTELDDRINLFLMHMCLGSKEASLALNNLLNEILEMGEQSFRLENVNRLTGILAATILVYHCPDKSPENKLLQDMKYIFKYNLHYYTPEDTDYLMTIFCQYNEYDCLLYLLETLTLDRNKEQSVKRFVDIFVTICEMYRNGIYSNRYQKRPKDGETFIKKCENLFDSLSSEKGVWNSELARCLFDQHKYEEARQVWDAAINNRSQNLSMLYLSALFYAWAAEKKEKDTNNSNSPWKKHIDKAMEYIDAGIKQLSSYNENEDATKQKYRIDFYLEKSFLLSEQEKYDEAYDWLKKASKIANPHRSDRIHSTYYAIENSNFDTHFWIISQYLKTNPNKSHTIISKIIESFPEYHHCFPIEYYTIFDFIINDEFLTENGEEQSKVCEYLLLTLLNAQEIKHISKIRDPSQFDIIYYTKLSNLRLLFEDEKEGEIQYRMPLFHAHHMNDPQEGKILDDYLNHTSKSATAQADGRITYEENYVFLKSYFSYPKKDGESHIREFLPMWVQYGDDAKGCCVVLNSKTFEGCTLRKITYLSDEWRCDDEKTNKLLEEFKESYDKAQKICTDILEKSLKQGAQKTERCALEIQSILKHIVSHIAYLFKHESYKHENEVRLIKTLSESNLTETKTICGEIPKTYIYNDSPTFIDEIIMGAKVQNPEDYIPFFSIHGRKMWESEPAKQLKISHSALRYR